MNLKINTVLLVMVLYACPSFAVINIGALLSSQELAEVFQQSVQKLNLNPELESEFNSTYSLMNENPMHAARSICERIIPQRVVAVIISSTKELLQDNTDLSTMAASFTCGFYKIPNIAVSMRMSTFSNKNLHPFFLRTVPPYSEQSEVWIHILLHYGFKKVLFMVSTEIEGRSLLSKFQSLAALKDINIEAVIRLSSVQHMDQNENQQILRSLPSYRSRVVLLGASLQDSDWIFQNAMKYNLTTSGYVWIVCERSLASRYLPQGTLAVRLLNGDDEKSHIKDAVSIIGEVFKKIQADKLNLTLPPSVCGSQDDSGWQMGEVFRSYLMKAVLYYGSTGNELRFSRTGDQSNASYEIVNFNQNIKVIGHYGKKDGLRIHRHNVIWPGNQHIKPKGVKINTNLRVVTIESVPFVYTEDPLATGKCDTNQVECTKLYNNEGVKKCCRGYVIEMLMQLSLEVNFTYSLHLVADNRYGTFERRNGSLEKSWDGMMAELLTSQSDMIAAPLTIDPERARFIGFSKPFKYQGLTILVKKTMKDSSLASFLQPFQNTLWILVGLSVHVVALVLYLLDHFSPFGRFKLAKNNDTEEDALNLSSAMWFSWGVLLNSGIGEGTPRSFSARVLGMVWAGFAMIIVASYTANLAAFLVLDRREASLSGINDARLRNPQQNFKYATVKNSAVLMYFKRQVELSSMYRTMLPINYDNAEEAIMDVKNGKKLQAFIWDSSRLEYEASKDCDLSTAGELFGRSGYGIGLTKDSPWIEPVSLAILKFHESGFMEQLDAKYILANDGKCPEKDMSPATLGLTNMAGVFMMVAGGIIAGVLLIFIEIAYKRHRGLKDKEMHLAKMAVDRWRSNIEKRRILRETVLLQLQHDDLHGDLHNRQSQDQWSSLPSTEEIA